MRFTFTDRAAPFCQLGFDQIRVGGGSEPWDTAHWDSPTSTWSSTEPRWRDISCDVYEASCEYGRAAIPDRFVPGSLTVVVRNVTGWADPEELTPGRAIRIGVDHDAFGRIVLFRGYVDAIIPTYTPGYQDTVELQCVDALAEVNRISIQALDVPANAGDTADVRIHRLLDKAKWPLAERDIMQSSWTLMAHEQGGQMADLLGQVGDSVGGSVWGDREARIAFRTMDWQTWTPSTPLDGVIGNVEDTDVCPGTWQRPFDRASISTQVIVGRSQEDVIIANDLFGQMKYGLETFIRVDLLTEQDARLTELAERTLAARSWRTAPRVRAVALDARNGDAQLDLMTTVDVFKPSHYRCRLFEGHRGLVFDDRYIATGVAHTITADAWTLELNLDRAAPYFARGGRWDAALWNQATWVDLTTPLAELAELLREEAMA